MTKGFRLDKVTQDIHGYPVHRRGQSRKRLKWFTHGAPSMMRERNMHGGTSDSSQVGPASAPTPTTANDQWSKVAGKSTSHCPGAADGQRNERDDEK